MTRKIFKTIALIIIAAQFSITAAAQNAEVYGYVKDAMTDDMLPGATVAIVGTSMGTITNNEGLYRISNIPPGDYILAFSYIGFLTEKVEITLDPGEKEQVDMPLVFDAVNLGEVVVTTQILGQAKALNQQLNSDALVNVVSSDKIEELPDANAAEAIGRLPGISVSRTGGEANKVTVRGLSPKLTSITINGVKVAPTSIGQSTSNPTSSSNSFSDDRSVDLSMISPELLSSIEVFKSPTADMDGDAIGGIVNLGVTKAPNDPKARIQTNGGFNTMNNEFSNYKASVDGSRRFLDNSLGILAQGSYEKINRSSQTVRNSYNMDFVDTDERWPLNRTIFVDDVRNYERYGANATVDYKYETGFVVGQGFYSQRNGETFSNQNYIDDGGEVRHLPSYSKSQTLTYQGVLSGEQRLLGAEMNWTLAKSQTVGDNYYDLELYLKENQGVLVGDFVYTPEGLEDNRTYDYENGYLQQYAFEPDITEQDNVTAALDFKYDFNLFDDLAGFLKIGGKYRKEDRSRDHNHQFVGDYYLTQATVDKAVQNMGPDGLVTNSNGVGMQNFYNTAEELSIWDGTYSIDPAINKDYLELWHQKQKGELHPQLDRSHEKYTLTEKVSAAYIMTKLVYSDLITFIPGVRYEHSDNNYQSYYSSYIQNINGDIESGALRDTTSTKNYGELLPSFHLKIKPIDWFDLRISAVKTLARPDYSMITPRIYVNQNNQKIYKGNPELKHSTAWSYDVMASFFSNKLGLMTIGGFFKKFDNYFAEVEYDMSSDLALSYGFPNAAFYVEEDYMNFDNSKVYGFELDIQTNFSFLPSPFNGIVFNANMTRLWSETYNPKFNPRKEIRVGRETFYEYDTVGYFEKSVLPDQVELAGNVSLGYDYKGFSCRFSMIYQSPSLRSLSSASDNIEYFKNYSAQFLRFDASFSQKIGKHVKVTANIANITNETELMYRYDEKYWTRDNRYGTTFDFGLQYRF